MILYHLNVDDSMIPNSKRDKNTLAYFTLVFQRIVLGHLSMFGKFSSQDVLIRYRTLIDFADFFLNAKYVLDSTKKAFGNLSTYLYTQGCSYGFEIEGARNTERNY